jgi:hypothetical protein
VAKGEKIACVTFQNGNFVRLKRKFGTKMGVRNMFVVNLEISKSKFGYASMNAFKNDKF